MNKINIINDLLVGLRNGYSNKNKFAYCKSNKFCFKLLEEFRKEELIHDFFVIEDKSKICIKLKYFRNKPLISQLELISKPSLTSFSTYEDLNFFYKKYDYFFISTSFGIISSRFLKKNFNIGGKVLFGLKLIV